MGRPLSLVAGCSGPALTEAERRFFRGADPLGFILFRHNCETPTQVRALIDDLRDAVGRADAPVLIDQEGGRVARLRAPQWWEAPPAAAFARLADTDPDSAREAAFLSARLLAHEMHALGITVDCAPVLDIPQPGADPIIGDRAYGTTPERVAALGRAACEGFLAGGVLPVIKHIPGHGRAEADSHKELPVVRAARAELERLDFAPFKALADMPWAMTAHVVYTALDATEPATTSRRVVDGVIRGELGFKGLLISDDLAMEALQGTLPDRARRVIAGGCDVVLDCNTERKPLAAVAEVAAVCPPLSDAAQARLAYAESFRRPPEPFDVDAGKSRLAALLGTIDRNP
ncbi:MAG: beta-N-acetylhexosaminidase [Magnetospirillum sp. WYHS-4]